MKQQAQHPTFETLIREHERIVFKICYLYANNQADRQDLYQEIVMQAWKGYPKYRGDAKFSTWLYQVAINTALTGIRLSKRSVIDYTDAVLPEISDAADHRDKEQLDLLTEAIARLNDIEKAIIMLYLDDKNYDEMEQIMGISNATLRVKMTRIKDKLKKITQNR